MAMQYGLTYGAVQQPTIGELRGSEVKEGLLT